MDRSGLGLLPGLAVALLLALALLALVLLDSWWVIPVVAVGLALVTGAVVFVLLAVLEGGDDEDGARLRRHVPGL